MRRHVLVIACCFALSHLVSAQDDAQVKSVLDRAAQALGGADKLTKHRGVSWKGKGKFKQMNVELTFDGEAFAQDADKLRQDLALGENQVPTFSVVISGEKTWVKNAMKVMPLPEQLAPLRADLYAVALSQKPHLLSKKPFELTGIGEVQVEGRAALGVRVAAKDWPDVTLFYDKESGLPVKAEVRVKDPATAQEANDEFFLSEYKEEGGLKHYTKLVGKRDGNDYIERELTEVRWHEQLPDNLFTVESSMEPPHRTNCASRCPVGPRPAARKPCANTREDLF